MADSRAGGSQYMRAMGRRWWMLLAGLTLGLLIAQLITPVASNDNAVGVLVLGGVVGVTLAAIGAIWFERTLGRVNDASDLEACSGLAVLAYLTREAVRAGNPVVASQPASLEANSYRRLAASLLSAKSVASGSIKVLVASLELTSAHAMVSANLALALEEAGNKVVLVAGDRRRNDIDAIFSLNHFAGLQQVLDGQAEVTLAEISSRLRVLPSGKTESFNFLIEEAAPTDDSLSNLLPSASRFEAAMSAASGWADVVVVDAPPALAFADAQIFAAHCDTVILSVTSGVSSREQIEQFQTLMQLPATPILGCVLLQRGELRAARLRR